MRNMARTAWLMVTALVFAFATSCREDSEEKFNPNDQNYDSFAGQFDAVYNGILYSYPYWDIDTANIIGRHDYWRAKAVELDKQDSVDSHSLATIYVNMYGTMLDHHLYIRVKNLKPLYSQRKNVYVTIDPGFSEVIGRDDYVPPVVDYDHVEEMISKLQEEGRVTEWCRGQVNDFGVMSCLIDGKILYFYLRNFMLYYYLGKNDSEAAVMVNKVVDNYLDIISTKQDLQGVIIDVRGNGGGIVVDQWTVLGALIDSPRLLLTSRRKNGTGMYDYDPFVETYVTPHERHLLNQDAKIVGLCDVASASSAEAACAFIKNSPNGYLIGSRTFGGTCIFNGLYEVDYAGRFGSREGKHYVELPSTLVLYGADRTLYEGVGVTPNETVPFDYKLFVETSEDNQLNAAINYIKSEH